MTITQADREAAADFLETWEPGPEMTVVKLARAFAAHREAERRAIVEWLRWRWSERNGTGTELWLADAIENGAHHAK